MAPLLIFALSIEDKCLFKLLTGLGNDSGVGVRTQC
jgi:hypothetical protein